MLRANAFPAGTSGNPGGRPAKPFAAALLRIVEKKVANDPEGRTLLDVIAQQLVDKASKGDLGSIHELSERIDGKPSQSVAVGGDASALPIQIAMMSPEEKRQSIVQLLFKMQGSS